MAQQEKRHPYHGRPLLYSGHSGHTGHRLGHVQPKLPEVLGMPQLQAGMLVLFLAFGSGLIGFLDDFIKVVRHRNLGLTEAQKMIEDAVAAL